MPPLNDLGNHSASFEPPTTTWQILWSHTGGTKIAILCKGGITGSSQSDREAYNVGYRRRRRSTSLTLPCFPSHPANQVSTLCTQPTPIGIKLHYFSTIFWSFNLIGKNPTATVLCISRLRCRLGAKLPLKLKIYPFQRLLSIYGLVI